MDPRAKVLVIDPDARVCRALRDALEGAGFATVGAHSDARARTLLVEPPRPVALVVGATDPFWRDGMVHDFRALERELVIVPLLAPGDEYEALLEMGASACATAAAADSQLAPLLGRLLQVRRARAITTSPAPGPAHRPPPSSMPAARVALANRLDSLFREGPGSERPAAPPSGPVEVRVRTWDEYGALAPQLKRGSLFVETTSPRQVADEVRVRIVVPDGRSVELSAEVGNVVSRERAATTGKPAGMGVRFVDLGDAEQHALAAFEQAYRAGGVPAAPPPVTSDRVRTPTVDPASFGRPRSPVPPIERPPSSGPQPSAASRPPLTPAAPARVATVPAPPARAPVAPPAEVDRRRLPTEPVGLDARAAVLADPPRPGAPRYDARAPTQPGPVAPPVSGPPVSSPRASVPPARAGAPREPVVGGGRTKAEVLRDHLAELLRTDYFTLLGVTPDVNAEDLRLAFVGLAKKWHPNKFAIDGPEVRGLATEIFITLKKARDTLSDPKKLATHRARYEAAAAAPGAPRRPDKARVATPDVDDDRQKARGGR